MVYLKTISTNFDPSIYVEEQKLQLKDQKYFIDATLDFYDNTFKTFIYVSWNKINTFKNDFFNHEEF